MFGVLWTACRHFTELEGTWIGYETRKPLVDWELNVQGDHFALIREDSGMWYKGVLRLNNNCNRKKIDFQISETPVRAHKGKVLFGIYEIDVDTLIVISNEPEMRARPDSFDEFAKSMEFVFFRR